MGKRQLDRRADETPAEQEAGKYDPGKPEPGRRHAEGRQEGKEFGRPASRSFDERLSRQGTRGAGDDPIDDEPGDREAERALQAADGDGDERQII
jgi:hypothetical protein